MSGLDQSRDAEIAAASAEFDADRLARALWRNGLYPPIVRPDPEWPFEKASADQRERYLAEAKYLIATYASLAKDPA